ncbi:hypothetical protein BV898_01447 [Hypsibius exemplaris]|uniref:Peptidase M12A domain-containing protein n=1 Tax=Hypsibius exemplaris TaxID=2072580 RepID=A0A1W0XC73_HYPEX|nr:hypothetical protein BV898_01447 [Hypsibius exemplaris]
MASCLLASVVLFYCATASVQGALLSVDTKYQNWVKLFPTDGPVRIPVYIDQANYTTRGDTTCVQRIKDAYAAMNRGLNGCIQFFEITSPVNVGRPFLWVSQVTNNNVLSPTCAAVPGRMNQPNNEGQKLIILGGNTPGSCCGTVRDVMRYFANTLGLRNEYQRADRETFIQVPATSRPGAGSTLNPLYTAFDPYQMLPTTVASTFPFGTTPAAPFDFNSITMVPNTKYMTSGTAYTNPLTTPATGTFEGNINNFPNSDEISGLDCQAIAAKYGCLAQGNTCANPSGR